MSSQLSSEVSDLSKKLLKAFPGLIVNKRLSSYQEVSRLPRFISEYLVSKFCGLDYNEAGFKKLLEFVRQYYPDPSEKNRHLHNLMTTGKLTIIDEIKVEIDIKRGIHKVVIPSLGIVDAAITPPLLKKHENLLTTGMWGVAKLQYEPSLKEDKRTPIILVDFTPFQVSKIDLNAFFEGRRLFSLEEWIDVLMNTIGLNPEVYSGRQKLLTISRLIPLISANVNMVELGPRATGKTFLYRNTSYYIRIISGGRISPAMLFYNIASKTYGLIAVKDAVIFDEVSRIEFSNPAETVGKLKDYMESGMFERGPKQAQSTCSLVFLGNIDLEEVEDQESYTKLFPKQISDSAFVDRIHGLLPGWELPKILLSEVHLSKGYGFVSDYFAEILHNLRNIDYQRIIGSEVELTGEPTIRDEKAILRTASGLIKLLFPHGEYDKRELALVMDIAVELRQRVASWLSKISPTEYPEKKLGYIVRG